MIWLYLLSLYARRSLHLPGRIVSLLSRTKQEKVDGDLCAVSQELDPQAEDLMTETVYLG